MNAEQKNEIREIVKALTDPLEVEFRSAGGSRQKEISRLLKQSEEHYDTERKLDEKIATQVKQCQNAMSEQQEKSTFRIGENEKNILRQEGRINDQASDLQALLEEVKGLKDSASKRRELWVVGGLAVLAPFLSKIVDLIFG